MWDKLLKAINDENEKEALRLIDQMKPEDFHLEQPVNDLLSINPDIKDIIDIHGYTILHLAVLKGYEIILDKLLSISPNSINVTDHAGRTLLHYAVQSDSKTIVDKLLSINPKLIILTDKNGFTALHYTAMSERYDDEKMIKILSISPELVGVINKDGFTALHYMVEEITGINEQRKYLVSFNYQLKCIDNNNRVNELGSYSTDLSLGRCYGMSGCFSPKMIQFHSTLSHYSKLQNYLDKCIEHLTKLVRDYPDNPDNADYQYKLGNILLGLGRKEEGMKAYEEALKLDHAKYHEKIIDNLNENEKVKLIQAVPPSNDAVKTSGKEELTSSNGNNNELGKEMKKAEIDIKTEIERAILEINELEQKLKLDMEIISKKRIELEKELQLLKSYKANPNDNKVIANTEDSKAKALSIDSEKVVNDKDSNDRALIIKQAKVENNTNSGNKEIINKLNVDIDQGKLPSATTSFVEKINSNIASGKAKLNKSSLDDQVKKQPSTSSTSTTSDTTIDNTNKKEDIADAKTAEAKTESLNKTPAIYSNEKMNKLLSSLESQDTLASIIDLETGKLAKDRIESLLKPVIEEGKTACLALHLHGESWASLVIKKQGDNLQMIYNDPRGSSIKDEKKVKSLINTIKYLEDVSISTFDLMFKQQMADNDSAPMVIDNLITLANHDTTKLKKLAIQKLLSGPGQLDNIKSNHSIMLDDNPWYGDNKIDKILHIKLADKEKISIAPSIEFERKDLLIENITVAAKEVIDSGKIAVMPLHLHGNHWTALVIKKQVDGSLQILYNDPKGNSLMSEKNSGALLKAVSKVNTEFTLIDICLKQQDNDDDCGPFTVENLVVLATSDTNSLHKKQLQKLLQLDNNNDATAVRTQHADELNKVGISVVMPKCSSNEKLTEEINQFAFAEANTSEINTKVEFLPPSPPAEKSEMEVMGTDSNY